MNSAPAAAMRQINIHHIDQHKTTLPSKDEQEIWEELEMVHDYGQPLNNAFEQRRKEFEQKLEEYGLWEGDETLFNDNMENIGQAWETAENDEMLAGILQETGKFDQSAV